MAEQECNKKYTLYVMRSHFQVRAKQKMLGSDWYIDKNKEKMSLYKILDCPEPLDPELKNVEKYEINLSVINPNLLDLYSKIKEACPEFNNPKSFHLYYKYSATKVLPISNYISYLSMVSQIADTNDNLYLIAREWDDKWLKDEAARYVPIPEDVVLVNMVSPRETVFNQVQENYMEIVKSAARPEYTRTYSPPVRQPEKGTKVKGKEKSPKKDGKQRPTSPGSKSSKKGKK